MALVIASITLSSFSNHKSLNILLGLETSRYLWGEAIVGGGGGGGGGGWATPCQFLMFWYGHRLKKN